MSEQYLGAHRFIATLNENGVDCTETVANLMKYAIIEDVAPVVHAHWIGLDSDAEKYDDIKCSSCNKSFTVDAYRWCDIGFTESDLIYCPNCGAKMDWGE